MLPERQLARDSSSTENHRYTYNTSTALSPPAKPTMEAVDGSSRQSGILSIINREPLERSHSERSYTSAPSMAATAVVSPVSMYSSGPPPPYSNWPGQPGHSTAALVSPPEPRRTLDNKAEPPSHQAPPPQVHRQSLPSIHEALSASKPSFHTSPVPAPLPHSHSQQPYSQGPSIPRTYAPSDHTPYASQPPPQPRQPSPAHSIHHQPSNPFVRPEPPSTTFSDTAARHPPVPSFQGPPVTHNSYPPTRFEPPRYETDARGPERVPNGYNHHPPPHTHGPTPGAYPYQAPSHAAGPHDPSYNQPRYPREGRPGDEAWKVEDDRSHMAPVPFKQGLKRRYLVWDFENYLSSINVSSGALQSWSNHFHTITQEQQPRDPNGVPDRMPTLENVNEMLQHQDKIRMYLERMRDMISQQNEHAAMMDQHMREHGGKGPGYYDSEMSVYGDDLKSQGFGPESKKRRGRAAPPGRCHSCNRAETPEWRRGPDGARTLCNACGLHYAKLTRKNTMKQSQSSTGSSLRPKSMDDV
ncbi:hypothetical protein HYFRA_00010152 [Hymenoscyphus fraxineus]|uniref:GATA-type domain-containing protein n=1 Tax=Hymenoscyphus fraxineus TaxID=746836 RepID=A0A9N9PHR2_9HELO|nr:hypothetical protein HYFRA_00010152 [Hymenoscyphus fraxineus]